LELTLGVEEKFHLVDLATRRLVARAPELLASLPAGVYAAELQRSVVESNTEVVSDLDALRRELTWLRRGIVGAAERLGIGVVSAGTVPLSLSAEPDVTESPRYRRMLADYQLVAREQLICGLQMHVGVADRDLAVAVSRRIEPYLPMLLALSASCPFWSGGIDTGYASVRSLVWQRWPTSGQAGPVRNAAEYDALVDDLIATGVITDPGMVYFDTRASAHLPTLELRVCDATPLVGDAVLVAGLFRALVLREARAQQEGIPIADRPAPLYRAAMWRAARCGMEGELLDFALGRPVPATVLVSRTVDGLRPELEAWVTGSRSSSSARWLAAATVPPRGNARHSAGEDRCATSLTCSWPRLAAWRRDPRPPGRQDLDVFEQANDRPAQPRRRSADRLRQLSLPDTGPWKERSQTRLLVLAVGGGSRVPEENSCGSRSPLTAVTWTGLPRSGRRPSDSMRGRRSKAGMSRWRGMAFRSRCSVSQSPRP
jgi:YbdK family carboxylate-amine ligase